MKANGKGEKEKYEARRTGCKSKLEL